MNIKQYLDTDNWFGYPDFYENKQVWYMWKK